MRIQAGQMWQHKRRGSVCRIESLGTLQSENPEMDNAEVVVYTDLSATVWVRPVDEFLDGRFTLLS